MAGENEDPRQDIWAESFRSNSRPDKKKVENLDASFGETPCPLIDSKVGRPRKPPSIKKIHRPGGKVVYLVRATIAKKDLRRLVDTEAQAKLLATQWASDQATDLRVLLTRLSASELFEAEAAKLLLEKHGLGFLDAAKFVLAHHKPTTSISWESAILRAAQAPFERCVILRNLHRGRLRRRILLPPSSFKSCEALLHVGDAVLGQVCIVDRKCFGMSRKHRLKLFGNLVIRAMLEDKFDLGAALQNKPSRRMASVGDFGVRGWFPAHVLPRNF